MSTRNVKIVEEKMKNNVTQQHNIPPLLSIYKKPLKKN